MNEIISVVIPAWNSEAFIEKAVQSVLAQELLPEEIVIVDDGSTDKTKEIVRKLVAGQRDKKPRIKYILQANQGPAAARNAGLRPAGGEFVAFLDKVFLQTLFDLRHFPKSLFYIIVSFLPVSIIESLRGGRARKRREASYIP